MDAQAGESVVQVPEPVSPRYRNRAGKCRAATGATVSSMNRAFTLSVAGFLVGFSEGGLAAEAEGFNKYRSNWTYLAPPGGLEPPTVCLEGSCSIPLSYGGLEGNRQNLRLQA